MSVTTKMTFTTKASRPGVSLAPLSPPKRKVSFKDTEYPKQPPSPICAAVNDHIRFNSAYAYPNFDFASYVRHRSYTISTIDFGRSMAASFLDDGVHDILRGLISDLPPSAPLHPSYEIRDAREKGLGMFATSSVPLNGLIFDEHPVIMAPYLLGVSVPLAEMYTELFESLPKSTLVLASSLATSNQDDSIKPKSASSSPLLPPPSFYEDIMRTNSVAIDLLIPTESPYHELTTHRALFLHLSRCNHSCDPNAVWRWNASTLTLTITALRPISPGEEITISYISLSGDHAAQREALKNQYGFECTCEECTLPSYVAANSSSNVVVTTLNTEMKPRPAVAEIRTSDSGETTIDESCDLPTFEEWYQDTTLPDTMLIKAHKNALRHIQKQIIASSYLTLPHLDPEPQSVDETAQLMDYHVEVIAMCYGVLGDVANFRKWISIIQNAKVHPQRKLALKSWLSNPSSFPMWDTR